MQDSKTIKDQLKENYPYKIELHAHTTPVSFCGEASPEELVKIYSELGYHGIVITNHFFQDGKGKSKEEYLEWYIKDYEDAKSFSEKYGISVLLGAEVKFSENLNDYLIYGVDYDVLSMVYDYLDKGLEIFRREVKLENSLLIQAHPFRSGMTLMNPELLDGVETFNMHPGHNSRVAFALGYAKENNFTITTAGSDFHHLNIKHEGTSALRVNKPLTDSFEVANILRQKDYVLEIGGEAIVLP